MTSSRGTTRFYRVLAITGWALFSSVIWCAMPMRGAEANTGVTVRNVLSYAFQPVNCVGELVQSVATDTVKFVWCLVGNLNRHPTTLTPIIETHKTVEILESETPMEHP